MGGIKRKGGGGQFNAPPPPPPETLAANSVSLRSPHINNHIDIKIGFNYKNIMNYPSPADHYFVTSLVRNSGYSPECRLAILDFPRGM